MWPIAGCQKTANLVTALAATILKHHTTIPTAQMSPPQVDLHRVDQETYAISSVPIEVLAITKQVYAHVTSVLQATIAALVSATVIDGS